MQQAPAQLAFQHTARSFLKGLLWAMLLVFLIGASFQAKNILAELGAKPPVQWQIVRLDTALDWMHGLLISQLFVVFFLGIPAVVGALLRLWPMTLLFRHYLENREVSIGYFLFVIFIFFEVTVVLAAVLSFGIEETQVIGRLAFCQAVSLPWLYSSLRVGRQLLLAERNQQVAADEGTNHLMGVNQSV